MYCVLFVDGYHDEGKFVNGSISLLGINQKGVSELLFTISVERARSCNVGNNGVVICCDKLNTEKLEGRFLVFDRLGAIIFERKTTANLGDSILSEDGLYAVFETSSSTTNDSNKLFIVDTSQQKIISSFEKAFYIYDATIDSINKLITKQEGTGLLEFNFEGEQVRIEEYEQSIWEKGTILEKLELFEEKEGAMYSDNDLHISLLKQALDNRDCVYHYGVDRLLRAIGEGYELKGDNLQAVEYWGKALEVNPKVGIMKRYNKLKSELS